MKSNPRPRPHQTAPPVPDAYMLAGAVLLVVLTVLVYLPSLRGEFIVDDNYYLTDNSLIAAADGLYRFWFTGEALDYYPVSNSTLWIEWRLWGMDPTGYRVTNLVLHIIGALLIWAILQRLLIPGAFLAALLFAVHPVNVESVAWIAQRKDMMAVLFFLLSILWYLKSEAAASRRPGAAAPATDRWYWLSLLAFVLAMLSKGSVAILPPLLLLIIAWLRPLTTRDWLRVAPFFLVSLVLVPVNIWFQNRGVSSQIRPAGFVERLLGAGAALWFYLYKALLPLGLAFIYPQWRIATDQLSWWLPLLAAGAATAVLWWYRHQWGRPLWFAWLAFAVSLAPVLGFTDVGFMQHSLVADHYQHIALIAVSALVAAGWSRWQQRARESARTLANVAAVALVAVLSLLTWQQSSLYATRMALYQDSLEKSPGSWMVHTHLGSALSQAGRRQEAIAHHEEAVRLNPDSADARNNLGGELTKAGRYADAIEHYRQALRLQPRLREAHYNLGVALAQAGQPQEAIEPYRQALRLDPNRPEIHYALAVALVESGQRKEAIHHFQEVLRLRPGFAEAHYNLGTALVHERRVQEGLAHLEQAVRRKPNYPEAHNNLATVLGQTGKLQEAIEHYREALRLKPDFADAQRNLRHALALKEKAETSAHP